MRRQQQCIGAPGTKCAHASTPLLQALAGQGGSLIQPLNPKP